MTSGTIAIDLTHVILMDSTVYLPMGHWQGLLPRRAGDSSRPSIRQRILQQGKLTPIHLEGGHMELQWSNGNLSGYRLWRQYSKSWSRYSKSSAQYSKSWQFNIGSHSHVFWYKWHPILHTPLNLFGFTLSQLNSCCIMYHSVFPVICSWLFWDLQLWWLINWLIDWCSRSQPWPVC